MFIKTSPFIGDVFLSLRETELTQHQADGAFYSRSINVGFFFIFILGLLFTGCAQDSSAEGPVEGPEIVIERFYSYISEAKIKGGGSSPAREAFKLISDNRSHYRIEQFLEVIKKYPPGFKVEVGEVKINQDRAVASISYMIPSMFEEGYKMTAEIPLTVDQATNTWKVDFTGETDSMDRESVLAMPGTTQKDVTKDAEETKSEIN